MQKLIPFGPIARCRSLAEYLAFTASEIAAACNASDRSLVADHAHEERWTVPGFSLIAKKTVDFEVDQQSGGYCQDGSWQPNLRERLVCPITHLNNRQRLICSLVEQRAFSGARLWFMERVTPVYAWAEQNLSDCRVIGSEYLDATSPSGTVINGIRHEDVEALSFGDASLDVIVSNEVLEHVPHPTTAFAECARVLTRSGRMIATIPFVTGADASITRAELAADGRLVHHLEPVFHGNPVSEDGSLVFTDFGWDVLRTIRDCGFRDCWFDVYHSPELGHYGDGLIVLEAVR